MLSWTGSGHLVIEVLQGEWQPQYKMYFSGHFGPGTGDAALIEYVTACVYFRDGATTASGVRVPQESVE